MDYHEVTLARYMDEVSKEEALNDAIERVLVKIEEEYPNVLPNDFDECYKIGYDIVVNDYNIDNYMEDWIEEHEDEIEHYIIRSHMWFVFLCEHPEVRTKRLIKKMYNMSILTAGHFYLLNQNTTDNAQSILNPAN